MNQLNIEDSHNKAKMHCFAIYNGAITYTQRLNGEVFHKAVPIHDTGYSDLLDGTVYASLKNMILSASMYRVITKSTIRQRLALRLGGKQYQRDAYFING